MDHTKLLFVTCFLVVLHSALGAQSGNSSSVRLSWYYYDPIQDIAWSGNNVVFILTTSYNLYRSTDEGQTWTAQFLNSTYSVSQMYQDPLDDKKFIFVANGESAAWTTVDRGETYKFISFGMLMSELHFNPNISGMLLTGHCPPYSLCDYYISSDFGQSFTRIGQNWIDAQWGELAIGGSPTTVYLLDGSFNFAFTNDYGRTRNVLFKLCYGFVFTKTHLFIAIYDNVRDVKLLVSTEANAVAGSYREAQFPFGDDLPQNSYTLLDDSTGGQYLGVANAPNWGTVYTSDSTGVKYTTSLKHVYHRQAYFDFAVFQGLEGIYIANNITNYDQVGNPVRTTVITFDNGGEWRSLAAPKVDSNGVPISCTGKCSLHLHAISDWISSVGTMGPFYSSPNAIGLFIATGNVGESLVTKVDEVNLYLSRDAGLTWSELVKGPHIYELGDHGGIIVFADTSKPTSELKYTLDEGLTVQTVALDQEVDVSNIIVEPAGTSHKFIMYGRDSLKKSVIIGVDFAGTQSRICGDDDYESWSPTDGRANGATCQLGRTVTYSRRKRDANCFNNRDTEHVLSVVNCECALEDYECDFGFEETIVGGKATCVLSSVNPPPDPPSYCPEGTTYEVSTGRRLVAGDSCVNESALFKPIVKRCPPATVTPSTTNKAMVAVVVIFVVLAVIGIAGFFVYRNDVWREKFLSIVGKVVPINQGPSYSRLGGRALAGDEEFGIGGDQDLDDDDVEEDAPELQDQDIQRATATEKRDDFNPRT